jgi:hypothetical protein
MKKFIIVSYFILMFSLTYIGAKSAIFMRFSDIEIKNRESEHTLNDTEIEKNHIEKEEGKKVVQVIHTKETRTKTLYGWDTKIDTVSSGFLNRSE